MKPDFKVITFASDKLEIIHFAKSTKTMCVVIILTVWFVLNPFSFIYDFLKSPACLPPRPLATKCFVSVFINPCLGSMNFDMAYLISNCYMAYLKSKCFCVHKSHYNFYFVHNNVLQHVLCIWCYYVLVYFVRNDENKDAQSINHILFDYGTHTGVTYTRYIYICHSSAIYVTPVSDICDICGEI